LGRSQHIHASRLSDAILPDGVHFWVNLKKIMIRAFETVGTSRQNKATVYRLLYILTLSENCIKNLRHKSEQVLIISATQLAETVL
jgi:hypothetical protein